MSLKLTRQIEKLLATEMWLIVKKKKCSIGRLQAKELELKWILKSYYKYFIWQWKTVIIGNQMGNFSRESGNNETELNENSRIKVQYFKWNIHCSFLTPDFKMVE